MNNENKSVHKKSFEDCPELKPIDCDTVEIPVAGYLDNDNIVKDELKSDYD